MSEGLIDSVSLTAMQRQEHFVIAAQAEYDVSSTDEEYAAAHAKLSEAIKALALTPIERPSDYMILVRHARIIAQDEAEHGEWLDGRFKLLLAAVEAAAHLMVDRLTRLATPEIADTRAAA